MIKRLVSVTAFICLGCNGNLGAATITSLNGTYGRTVEGGRFTSSNGYRWDAVVVFEIDTPVPIENARISGFELLDGRNLVMKSRRIVSVEISPPGDGAERECRDWRSPEGVQAWTGNVPAGKTRIRVRVELESPPPQGSKMQYRLRLGEHKVEGAMWCGRWAS